MSITKKRFTALAALTAAIMVLTLLAGPALAAGSGGTDVGPEQAEAIALEAAGLKEEDVSRLRTVQDRDDGALEYEVEFFTDEAEYDYAIAADTGALWQESWELLRRGRQDDGDMGADAAISAALDHAALTEEDVQQLTARRELDDGYLEYEVRWCTDDCEYEYVVDGAAGTVWQWEKTMLPAARTDAAAAAQTTGDIGAEAARDAALERAGLTLEQVTQMHVEWENSDDYSRHHDGGHGHSMYEVSFCQGRQEYECMVDAATGEVLAFESEYDD